MTRRRIVPPGFGWPTSLTPTPAPAGEPSMIQAHNCNKFYHLERLSTLPICDRLPLPGMPRARCADPVPATPRAATKVAASALAFRPVVKADGQGQGLRPGA